MTDHLAQDMADGAEHARRLGYTEQIFNGPPPEPEQYPVEVDRGFVTVACDLCGYTVSVETADDDTAADRAVAQMDAHHDSHTRIRRFVNHLDPDLTVHLTTVQAENVRWVMEQVIGYVCYQQPMLDIEGQLEDTAWDLKRLLDSALLTFNVGDTNRRSAHQAIVTAAADRLAEQRALAGELRLEDLAFPSPTAEEAF